MVQGHRIDRIEEDSIAMEMEIEPGDILLEINGTAIEDVFDYHYLLNDTYIEVLIRKQDGEEWLLEIDKDCEEDLGIIFDNGLMDQYRSCTNKCIFCFIDQMPPGMRDTLYFKDDDSRLSFLQGNYVTLTNMKDQDLDRIIHYHLSPINVSVHTTNPQLRCQMLHNRFAGTVLEKIQRLYEAEIEMNGQIVLCKGINDGKELERSILDLSQYFPYMRSLSVVPVGLSRFREGLYPLEPFEQEDARKVLKMIHKWQQKLFERTGCHFVHASDEWYLLADKPLPEEENYDGYPQLENGVGMLRLLKTEVKECLDELPGDDRELRCTIATGECAADFIRECVGYVNKKFPDIKVDVRSIQNDFFGTQITVAGLITGTDLGQQLQGIDLGEKLLIPCHMLRSGEEVFLDDMTVAELEDKLKIPIVVVDEKGEDLVKSILNPPTKGKHRRRQIYEQTDSSYCGKA